MHAAALVVVNTEAHLAALRAAYPKAANHMICVLNGCDEDPVAHAGPRTRFTVAYAGNIYFDRDPRALFRAAARVIGARGLTPDDFTIELLGDVQTFGDASVADLAAEAGVDAYVRVHPRRTRAEALQFMAGASVLLSLPQSAHLCIPSKIYEYMQFDAWVLALAEAGSATELVLRGTGADVAAPEDEATIAAILEQRYAEHVAGTRPPRLIETNPRLTRQHQAGCLFDALSRTLAANTFASSNVPTPSTAAPAAGT